MAADFTIRSGDLFPVISGTLTDAEGDVINLTGLTVLFVLRRAGAAVDTVNSAATVVDAAAGEVSYSWAAGDTATPGHYYAWWVIQYPSAKPLSVPNSAPLWIEIVR